MLIKYIFFLLSAKLYNFEIVVKQVEMRHLRINDIGLIFDVTVVNDPSKRKETFNFRIQCDTCCLTMPKNVISCDVAKLIGGYFGEISPGERKIVSLIWPTVTLYNRVGNCNITLISSSVSGIKMKANHTIHFDTTINTKKVTELVGGFLADVNYRHCTSPDLNPIRNCTPVDCDEKYFGRRNFFNTITNLCEEVPDCSAAGSKDVFYDYTINECVDFKRFVCLENIKKLQHGLYDENIWSPKHDVPTYANISHTHTSNGNKIIRSSSETTDTFWLEEPWNGFFTGFFVITLALLVYFIISCCTFTLMMMLWKQSKPKPQNISKPEDNTNATQQDDAKNKSRENILTKLKNNIGK